jgi:arylsulfatase A-like enzyme/Flp pilus assembly protein TadD
MGLRNTWARAAGAALVAGLVSCGPSWNKKSGESGLRPLNLVLITIDTLRADRLGCYGYRSAETPHLDRFAAQGALFENAVAQAPLTAPSHASMMTGLYPVTHKVRDTGNFVLAPEHATLAVILERAGWDTAAFVGASVLKKRFGFGHGFAVYDDEMPRSGASEEEPERRAADVVDRAIAWLGSRSGKPFFLWVHVYDPHLPYDPLPPFREKHAAQPYDGEVAYTDQQAGRLLDAVAGKSAPGGNLIAILSDHGESFGEHGEYAHGVFLYDTTVRIPWLIAGPGVPRGVRVEEQARTIDLLPTLLELMGGQAPRETQGTSLVPVLGGKGGAGFSYTETLFPKINMGWAELRAIRTARWKYIRAPRPELYDLANDPGETANAIASHTDEVKELERMLESVTGGVGTRKPETVETAVVDRRTLEQLKSLGYLGGSTPGEYALTGAGVDPKDRTGVLKLLHFATNPEPGVSVARRVAMLRQAIGLDSGNPTLYSNLGDLYRAAGREGEETRLYQDAVNHGVRNAWLYSRLGALYLRRGNKSEAITFLEGAARANPADYDSLQNLAVAYRETGRLDDAERVLQSIVKSGEEYAPAYNELGMVAFAKQDAAAARGYFEKAAQLDAAYQLNLARLYKTLGENARARAAFEAFLAGPAARPEYRRMAPEVRRELEAVR